MNRHSEVVYRLRTGVVNRHSDRILCGQRGAIEQVEETADF